MGGARSQEPPGSGQIYVGILGMFKTLNTVVVVDKPLGPIDGTIIKIAREGPQNQHLLHAAQNDVRWEGVMCVFNIE